MANFLGGIVGFLASLLTSMILGGFSLLIGGVMGGVMGLAQWQTLRDCVESIRGSRWVAFTALGFGLSVPVLAYLGYAVAFATGLETTGDPVQGWINLASGRGQIGPLEAMLALVGRFPSGALGGAAVGALVGAIVGTAQLFELRQQLQRAYLWVIFSAAAGAVGMVAALYLSIAVYDGIDNQTALFVVGIALSPAGIFALGSVVTGYALMRLTRKSAK